MINLFFIVFYIKLQTFSYIKLYITFNRKRSKYYHKKKTSNQRFSPGWARPSEKSFFHLFPKILTIVVSTSTWSQNEGKYLYILWEWKNFCLKVILYTDYVQYYVTQFRNFDTCLYISENKCTSPLKTMYGTFFFF